MKNNNDNTAANIYNTEKTFTIGTCILNILLPVMMEWKPKEDITVYELALCLPYLYRLNGVFSYEFNIDDPHMRHFVITDPNI